MNKKNKEYEQIMHFFRYFAYVNVIYIKKPVRSWEVYNEGYRIVVTTHSTKLRVGLVVSKENGKDERFIWKETNGAITFEGSARNLAHYLKYFENYTNKWDDSIEYADALF